MFVYRMSIKRLIRHTLFENTEIRDHYIVHSVRVFTGCVYEYNKLQYFNLKQKRDGKT
jgi:hypothetical protein